MQSSIPNQVLAFTTVQLEGQVALLSGLAGKTIENIEKIVKLNMSTAKAALGDATSVNQQLLSANGPGEFISLTVAQTQPRLERELAYGRQVASMASDMSAALIETAQVHITQTSHRMEEVMKEMAHDAPQGSLNLVEMLTSAIGNVNAGYEQFANAAKQVSETMQTTLANAADGLARSEPKANPRTTQ